MNAIEFDMKIAGNINEDRFKEYAYANKMLLTEGDENFKVGDNVTFTNEFGLVFPGHKIIGISTDRSWYGRYIYTDTDAWWFPHTPKELTKEN